MASGQGVYCFIQSIGNVLLPVAVTDVLAHRPVADGTKGFFYASDTALLYFDAGSWITINPPAPVQAMNAAVFVAGGNWTAPAGVTTIYVTACAGGGGGGGPGTVNGGSGGGGGDSIKKMPVTVVPLTVYAITIAAGGTAGSNTGPTNGGTGGTTSFDVLLSLTGGGGGNRNGGTGGTPGGPGGSPGQTAGQTGTGSLGNGGACAIFPAVGFSPGDVATASLYGCGGAGQIGGAAYDAIKGGAGYMLIEW